MHPIERRNTVLKLLLGLVLALCGCSQAGADDPPLASIASPLEGDRVVARVSLAGDGSEVHGASHTGSLPPPRAIGGDGRFVAFTSEADDLVPGPQSPFNQIYVKDTFTGQVARISNGVDGLPANGSSCCSVVVSANGRFVAFDSSATNLVVGDTNGVDDVFVHDRTTGITTRASVNGDGVQANADSAFPTLSADGRFVAFGSVASNLDGNAVQGVFVHDRQTGTTQRMSSPNASAIGGAISGDGQFVAFLEGDGTTSFVTVRDRQQAAPTRLIGRPVVQTAGAFGLPDISGNGLWLTFSSTASDLVESDSNGQQDVFLMSRVSLDITRVSAALDGTESDGPSFEGALDASGSVVVFSSRATNLVSGAPVDGSMNVYLFERGEGDSLSHVARGGFASISADGRSVAFASDSNTLVPDDTNGVQDVFVSRLPITGTISGSVRDLNFNPLAGVTVSVGTASVTTGANGRFSIPNLPEGSHTVQAMRPGFTFGSPSFVADNHTVTIPPENPAPLTIIGYDRQPIIYVHGAFGNSSNFHDVPDALESAGYYPQLVELDTSLASTPTLSENSKHVAAGVEDALHVTGQPRVILLGHSMGGLVSRAYLESGTSKPVSALWTFGTPHLGIPLTSQFVFMGVAGPLSCLAQPGLCEMMHPWIDVFNTLHLPRSGVDYHSIGGDAPMWRRLRKCFRIFSKRFCASVSWPDLRFRNAAGWGLGVLLPGADDAFIGTTSATSMHPLTGNIDRWVTPEVHFAPSLGDRDYFDWNDGLSQESYSQCLEPVLAGDRASCGSRGLGALAATAAEALDGSALPDVTEPSLAAKAALEEGTLQRGETLTRTLFVEGGPTVFLANWESGTAAVTLVDPMGKTFDRAGVEGQEIDPSDPEIDPNITAIDPDVAVFVGGPSSASYHFPNARPGEWQLVITGQNDVPSAGTPFITSAAFESPLLLSTSVDRSWYAPGSTLHLSASLSEPVTSAQLAATLRRSDGITEHVQLTPTAGGTYEASYQVPNVPGGVLVNVFASGTTAAGARFERGELLAFQITTDSLGLLGNYSDSAEPRPDDPTLNQALLVTVGISSSVSGNVALAGDLVDSSGKRVAHALTNASVAPGTQSLTLRFDGADIFASKTSGPYTLTRLLLVDQRAALLVAAEAQSAHVTAAYDYRSFAPARDLPVVDARGPYTVDEGSSVELGAVGSDPEGQALGFAWDLDDNGSFETSGATVNFSASTLDGPTSRTVHVRARDGAQHTVVSSSRVDVMNVAPQPDAGPDAQLNLGQAFERSASFSDPGPDSWSGLVDYGDGSGVAPLAIDGRSFVLRHTYARAGSYPVEIQILDDDGASGTDFLVVTVVGGPGAWQSNTAYAVGDQVTFEGITYECRQAHTALVGWEPPFTPALWQRPTPGTTTEWTANTFYPVQSEVTYRGRTYRCRQTHTSLIGWEPAATPALWSPQ